MERSHWQKFICLPPDWLTTIGHAELSQLRHLRPLPQCWVLTGKHCPSVQITMGAERQTIALEPQGQNVLCFA